VSDRFEYRRQVERELAAGTAMADRLARLAERAAEAARGHAPERTGHYVDSIQASSGVIDTDDGPTAVGRVLSDDFKAAWIEFGTVDTPVFAPLRKGTEQIGLSVTNAKKGARS
jgi:hypothetical protein